MLLIIFYLYIVYIMHADHWQGTECSGKRVTTSRVQWTVSGQTGQCGRLVAPPVASASSSEEGTALDRSMRASSVMVKSTHMAPVMLTSRVHILTSVCMRDCVWIETLKFVFATGRLIK